ncbi:ribose-phosphate pyrophosphokinase [Capronia coronata CBS 617.96]|uniref:ribose-phosphate diphosphokinase n=1 Tax=Capronia coronata CBS 617.96 TaxID=1182541 RepID=W9YMM6_9EURO|nr:ribose-phosphate pyrophosphokinase [Capronia coronata CBS 617.96]EXJ90481.1 ribose-phosphate pyrophosphokinase [Capronia coronata CBS 617.96]
MALQILAGSSCPEFADTIAKKIGCPINRNHLSTSRFSNGETRAVIQNSVRDAHVFILQTAAEPVNDMLMELLITVHACKIASARRITVVLPCFPYARQDKKDRSRAPITAKLVANILESAGCHHIITMDLHASQIQGFFDIPVDKLLLTASPVQLYAETTMTEYLRQEYAQEDMVIVSPDAGGARRAAAIADRLRVDLALIHKERKVVNQVSRMILVGGVAGKTAIIVDDIADTCGTLALAAQVLIDNGAQRCIAIVTHGFLSGQALQVIEKSALERLVVTNTLPLPEKAKSCSKIHTIDVGSTIAEAIRRTHNGES